MKNIVLVGFMGTGKTTVAEFLAGKLKKPYVNIDDLIEKKEAKTINDIFRDQGESYFRKIEKEIVEEVSRHTDQIIDAGGGVVLDEENMKNLKRTGVVVCLWTDPEVILERTKEYKHRPLLNVEDPLRRIKELLEYRRPFYEKADIHIDSTEWDVDVIAKKIEKAVHEEKTESC
jgi:shikimate kinase